MTLARRILHLDIDAFLATVEQIDDPSLRGRPVAVGSGVVASCSVEAKARGVRTAMGMGAARRICPALVVRDGDAHRAACLRDRVDGILRRHVPVVERASLDDFYGDMTGLADPPQQVSTEIRREVNGEVGFSVAQGIGATRTVARLATDLVKPGGIQEIPIGGEVDFLASCRVDRLPGVGWRTRDLFTRLGIRTVPQLRALGRERLAGLLGRRGEKLWRAAWARDSDPVRDDNGPERRARRQVSRETSLGEPVADRDLLEGLLAWLLDRALATCRAEQLRPRRLDVVLRYADNQFSGRGERLDPAQSSFAAVFPVALANFERAWSRRLLLRGLGVRLSRFSPAQGVQCGLWDGTPGRRERIENALESIRRRHGFGLLLRGRESLLLGRVPRGRDGFRLRTPSLSQ